MVSSWDIHHYDMHKNVQTKLPQLSLI